MKFKDSKILAEKYERLYERYENSPSFDDKRDKIYDLIHDQLKNPSDMPTVSIIKGLMDMGFDDTDKEWKNAFLTACSMLNSGWHSLERDLGFDPYEVLDFLSDKRENPEYAKEHYVGMDPDEYEGVDFYKYSNSEDEENDNLPFEEKRNKIYSIFYYMMDSKPFDPMMNIIDELLDIGFDRNDPEWKKAYFNAIDMIGGKDNFKANFGFYPDDVFKYHLNRWGESISEPTETEQRARDIRLYFQELMQAHPINIFIELIDRLKGMGFDRKDPEWLEAFNKAVELIGGTQRFKQEFGFRPDETFKHYINHWGDGEENEEESGGTIFDMRDRIDDIIELILMVVKRSGNDIHDDMNMNIAKTLSQSGMGLDGKDKHAVIHALMEAENFIPENKKHLYHFPRIMNYMRNHVA